MTITKPYDYLQSIIGDCVPMSCDNGKTWVIEYDYIQAHPEKEWKTYIEVLLSGDICNV